MNKQLKTIVLTGGPCSGKTTGLSTIEQELSNRGYYVIIIPETATELISAGIRPFGKSLALFDFQLAVLERQLHKEIMAREIAYNKLSADKIVILHDRGIIDNKSYVSQGQFDEILAHFSLNEVEARDRYDAVFHLVTAADGASKYYTLANNNARTETPEEAIGLDRRGISNWTGHSHLRVIDNSTDFKCKMNRLMNEIYSFLGDPVPMEIERKYLISMPDLADIASHTNLTVVDIVQIYLKSSNGIERRIRQRGQNGIYSYYLTEKRDVNCLRRVEVEKKISEKQYIQYLSEMDSSLSPIIKRRICFVYDRQYFEVDAFRFSDDFALLEIELTNENTTVNIPPFLKVIEEVTDNPNYRNYNLAKKQQFIM